MKFVVHLYHRYRTALSAWGISFRWHVQLSHRKAVNTTETHQQVYHQNEKNYFIPFGIRKFELPTHRCVGPFYFRGAHTFLSLFAWIPGKPENLAGGGGVATCALVSCPHGPNFVFLYYIKTGQGYLTKYIERQNKNRKGSRLNSTQILLEFCMSFTYWNKWKTRWPCCMKNSPF